MSVPTVILNLSASDVPDIIARITTFVLQYQYAFRQTIHPEPHTGPYTAIDIFPVSDPLASDAMIRISLRVAASPSEPVIQWPAATTSESPETAALLQHLLEVCVASGTT